MVAIRSAFAKRRPNVVLASLVTLTSLAAAASTSPEPTIDSPIVEVSAPVTPFVFDGSLLDLPATVRWRPGDPIREIPRRLYPKATRPLPKAPREGADPLVRAQREAAVSRSGNGFTAPTRNFAGQAFTGVSPPDTVGDVGPSHYLQAVNASTGALVAFFDKALPTPNLLTTLTLDTLGIGDCGSGFGDPVVLYDRHAQRWLISEFSSAGNNLCVYVSQTADPINGGWFNYQFAAPAFPDYPKYGVWPTDKNGGQGSYIVTANDGGPGVYALDRGAMLAGSPATYQRVTLPQLPGFAFEAATPADLDGPNLPPANAPAIVMRHRDTEVHDGPPAAGDLLEMWTFDVDWIDAGSSLLTARPSIDVADFDSDLCGLGSFTCFAQPNTAVALDSLREVIMFRLQYIKHDAGHESLVGNFVVDADGADQGGIRWFELRGGTPNWSLHQEGTWSLAGDSRWMAASAMDQAGNIALGYNVTSSSTFPSLRYTGRTDGDPPGTMSQPETVVHAGTASSLTNRYGDYAAMNLDPADDCTLWFTGEDNTAGTWRTQIASFRFDQCGCVTVPDSPTAAAIDNGDNRIDLDWDDSATATITEYRVLRSRSPGGPYELIATVPDSSPGIAAGPGYFYEDHDVSGGITYYYVIRSSDGGPCVSDPSAEVSATGNGPCNLPPAFAGLESIDAPAFGVCTLDLSWAAAATACGGAVSYDVYRSQDPGFVPGPANLVASGLTTTAFTDVDDLTDDVPYYYVVRATDGSNGAEDLNLVRRVAAARGQLIVGDFTDDAGDSSSVRMMLEGPWSVDLAEGNLGPGVYKTGDYGNSTCAGLVTPQMKLGQVSVLSFFSRYDIEDSLDKGEVQISLTGGNTWLRIALAYPGSSIDQVDNCFLVPGDYFTGTDGSWKHYAADLSQWAGQNVLIRFLISSSINGTGAGWWIDDLRVTDVEIDTACVTASDCADNPTVDVEPEGPLTVCQSEAPTLTATLAGGNGPIDLQWTRNGLDIPGATGAALTPGDIGLGRYNVVAQAQTCPDSVFDGLDTELTLVNAPFFDGATGVANLQGETCALQVDWDPATTACAGPVRYNVFRDTTAAVAPIAEQLIASGLAATGLSDTAGLIAGQAYHYLVQAQDQSTGQSDGNAVVVTATPTGPGAGIETFFFEDFENPATFADWTVTIGPGPHSCGEWMRSSDASKRPQGGGGFHALADNDCAPLVPRTSASLDSPALDLDIAGLQAVTLEYEIYFNHSGGEDATVEVWDGVQWVVIWADAEADLNAHQSFDVTAHAVGNPAFQVRFNYQNANVDQWYSVDDVRIITDIDAPCATAPAGPPSAPDGRGATLPLTGARGNPAGDTIQVAWDSSSCPASQYNLIYGDLAVVGSYAVSGSECSIGTGGSFAWTSVPPGSLYFLLVGSDGAGVESSWGLDGLLGERNGSNPSFECGALSKDTGNSCP